MNEREAMFAVGAWLGAVRDRLRLGQPPVPGWTGRESENEAEALLNAHADSYGATVCRNVPEWCWKRVEPIETLDAMLGEIHQLARMKTFESDLWYEILCRVPAPLCEKVALDLVDRNIATGQLGHRYEHDAVLWRLADEFPEAVHTLAILRYRSVEDGPDRLDELFNDFPWWLELGEILAREEAGKHEKLVWLAHKMREHKLPMGRERLQQSWDPAFREMMLEGIDRK